MDQMTEHVDVDMDESGNLHSFRPYRDDLGNPTLICRTCKGWYDAPQHERVTA